MADTSAFLDQQLVNGSLYESEQRLADRTGALMSAKITGRPTAKVIAAYAATARPGNGIVLDIGCGRGASTRADGVSPYRQGPDSPRCGLGESGRWSLCGLIRPSGCGRVLRAAGRR
ncbi:hypothetical protein [Streptomyces sp. NPDC097981]|uniref:hypothetical protein n=1 Tax=Streptomyces sp. NPDC097981 TaxID=3155428 RepID=UPI003331DB6E